MAPFISTPAEVIAPASKKDVLAAEERGDAAQATTTVTPTTPHLRPNSTLGHQSRHVPGARDVASISPYATTRRLLKNQIYLVERKGRYYVPVDTRKLCRAAEGKRRRLVRDFKVRDAEVKMEERMALERSCLDMDGVDQVEEGEEKALGEEGLEICEREGESTNVEGTGYSCGFGCVLM